eukprot:6554798-Alexandrium_andersonii.AAC.1
MCIRDSPPQTPRPPQKTKGADGARQRHFSGGSGGGAVAPPGKRDKLCMSVSSCFKLHTSA